MLETDGGDSRVIDDELLNAADADLTDLVGVDRPLREDRPQAVERGLDRPPDGIAFEIRSEDVIVLAQGVDDPFGMRMAPGHKGLEEIALPSEDVVHPGESGFDQHGRGHSGPGAKAAVHEALFDMVWITTERIEAGGLLRRIGHRPAGFLLVEAWRHRRPWQWRRTRRSCCWSAPEIDRRPRCQLNPRADIVAQRHGAKEMLAADPQVFAERECGGNDVDPRMPRAHEGVVGLVGVPHRAVQHGRFHRAQQRGLADDGRDPFVAASVGASEAVATRPAVNCVPETMAAKLSRMCHLVFSTTSAGRARSGPG